MSARVPALVKPDLIRWARTSCGMDLAQAAHKVPVAEERLAAWEGGTDRPTVNQLRKLAEIYKRPLAVFYLPERPRDFQVMSIKDFRRLPGTVSAAFSTDLRFEIRRSLFRRQVALEMMENLGMQPPAFSLEATLEDDPEAVGQRIREKLGVTRDRQLRWSAMGYDAFNDVRDALEANGVLVFQAAVPLKEMRGLAIYQTPLPLILISSKEEFMSPRLFTVVHELCHLMLHYTAISNEAEDGLSGEAERVEVFANHAAGAALVPMDQLLAEPEIAGIRLNTAWNDTQIERVARRYRVSKETVLRRLLIAGRVSRHAYQDARQRWQAAFAAIPKRVVERGPPVHVTELSRLGRLYPRLVLENYYRERITGPEVSEYLNLKLKHLSHVEAELRGGTLALAES